LPTFSLGQKSHASIIVGALLNATNAFSMLTQRIRMFVEGNKAQSQRCTPQHSCTKLCFVELSLLAIMKQPRRL